MTHFNFFCTSLLALCFCFFSISKFYTKTSIRIQRHEASLAGLERCAAELCLAMTAPSAQSAIIILLIREYNLSF